MKYSRRTKIQQNDIIYNFLLQMKRQQRKLNFLITQPELYAHFMARKMTGDDGEDEQESILGRLEEGVGVGGDKSSRPLVDMVADEYGKMKLIDKMGIRHEIIY